MKNVARLLVLTTAISACTPTYTPPQKSPDFRAALDNHLKMVTSRDLEGFKATLTKGDDLKVIFPNGSELPSTKDVVAFHSEWFQDKDWIMEPDVVKVIEGSDKATALIKYAYRDHAEGPPRSSWLVLVFALEDGEWRLVHDQNTRIDGEAPS